MNSLHFVMSKRIEAELPTIDPVRITLDPAYDGGFLNLPDFEYPVIVDLETLEVAGEPIPVLYAHNSMKRIGEIITIDVRPDKLVLSGVLYKGLGDAENIIAVHTIGGSWQCSIGTDLISPENQEYFPAGTYTLNNKTVEGPFILCRNVILREVSIVSAGADPATSVNIEAGLQIYNNKEEKMDYPQEFIDFVTDLGLIFDELTDAQKEALKAKFDLNAEAEVAECEPAPIQAEEAPPVEPEAPKEEEKKVEASLNRPYNAPRANTGKVIEAGLLLGFGLDPEKLAKQYGQRTVDTAMAHRGMSARTLMRASIEASGMSTSVYDSPKQLAKTFWRSIKAAASSTRDWNASGVMSNIQNRLLQDRYETYTGIARQLCRERSVSDFRLNSTGRLSLTGEVRDILPAGDFPQARIGDNAQTYKVAKQGIDLIVTFEDLINDDLGVMDQAAVELAGMLNQAQEASFWTLFLSGVTTRYSNANKNTVAQALSVDGLSAANAKFRTKKVDGRFNGMRPAFLLTPVALEPKAQDLFNTQPVTTTSGTGNPWAGRFQVLASEYLDDNSTDCWYLLPDPAIHPLGEIAYLDGQKTPLVESFEAKDNLTMVFKCWGTFGAAVYNDAVGVRSTGAGA